MMAEILADNCATRYDFIVEKLQKSLPIFAIEILTLDQT